MFGKVLVYFIQIPYSFKSSFGVFNFSKKSCAVLKNPFYANFSYLSALLVTSKNCVGVEGVDTNFCYCFLIVDSQREKLLEIGLE